MRIIRIKDSSGDMHFINPMNLAKITRVWPGAETEPMCKEYYIYLTTGNRIIIHVDDFDSFLGAVEACL